MSERIVGILKNISELLIATVVEETEHTITVKNVNFLGIGSAQGKVSINFIPIEMVSLNPPVNVRTFLATPDAELTYTFNKSSVLKWDYELNSEIISNYKQLVNPSPIVVPDNNIVTPKEKDIIKLF